MWLCLFVTLCHQITNRHKTLPLTHPVVGYPFRVPLGTTSYWLSHMDGSVSENQWCPLTCTSFITVNRTWFQTVPLLHTSQILSTQVSDKCWLNFYSTEDIPESQVRNHTARTCKDFALESRAFDGGYSDLSGNESTAELCETWFHFMKQMMFYNCGYFHFSDSFLIYMAD